MVSFKECSIEGNSGTRNVGIQIMIRERPTQNGLFCEQPLRRE